MRTTLRIVSVLCVLTFGYVWTVGQTGMTATNQNLCELWNAILPQSWVGCQFQRFILVLWGIGAAISLVFLIAELIRWWLKRSDRATPEVKVAAAIARAQEGQYPAKYIQVSVRAVGNVLGCQAILNAVSRIEGEVETTVYDQPLNAGWSGIADRAIDINDGQEARANLFSVSCIQEKWLLIPQTIHRDEALRIAVAPSGLYRLSVTISSKTITSEKQTYFLFWDGTFDNVKFDDARELTRPQDYPRDEHIPLHVAASEAYGATRGTIVSEMAERGEDPKHHINVLTWYATYMAVTFKAPIYGQMRLSPKREPVDMASFHFEMEGDDRIIAKETWGNKVWEHITIKRADLDRAIQGLQDTVREFNEQHRN